MRLKIPDQNSILDQNNNLVAQYKVQEYKREWKNWVQGLVWPTSQTSRS